ncbi:MAG: hypothetical protein A2Z34_01015 [Planctomycetes bacterium RBG_16_59_8]|nr:MAG: hypothetical protein A2Z34_01015 [Planctomycetes bacterium RBG_16_59_8]
MAALAGIKVAWEEEGRSQPILTDRRLQKIESPDWIEVAEEFPAPPKAATAKISLVIVGRNGVVRFDDVSVTGRKGTERIKKISLGIFDVLVSSNGHVSLFRAGTPIALDCRLGIFSRNGASRFFVRRAEVTETPPSAASPSGRLSIAAELVNPVNLDIIPCTIDLRHAAGDLTLTYTLPREPLLQIEGVELACALRNPDALAVIPGSGALPSRVSFTAGRFPLILEYFEPLKTAQTTIGSDLLLTATRDLSTKTSSTADAAFVIGFTLGEPIMLKENAVREEMEKAKRAMTSKTYGEALTLFGKLRRAINDVQILREIEENIKTIQGIEVARRREIELSLMEAQILLRPGDLEKLKRLIATYLAEFAGTAQADTMKEDGASIDLLVADAAGDIRQERAETLSKYAQDFFERGMARLAAMTAEKAESLLKGISDGGK